MLNNGNKQNIDPENMLKGRMAESLVEELLKKSGNSVYRFGYEAIIQNLTQIKKSFDAHCDAGERISAIPDFIVIAENGDPVFVEVKYRRDGKLHNDDRKRLERINDFWNAKIIFVNGTKKPYFQITNPPYLDSKGELACHPLIEEKAWKIDPRVYEEFEGLVEKYLVPKLKI
jgi:hypothetical protein